jgi:hypothetical protein
MAAPYAIGNQAHSPWLSIGLVVFAAVIYFSMVSNVYIAFLLVLLLCIFQSFTASLNLSSISDSADLSLLGSYFSFLWTFVIGISSIFIRRRYLHVADSIEIKVNEEIELSVERLTSLKQVNQKDSRNVRLHGTILNTLIHMKNLLQQGSSISNLIPNLQAEVALLEASKGASGIPEANLDLNSLVSQRTLQRINVHISDKRTQNESPQVAESILEIIREYVLNAEKHTLATQMSIVITSTNSGTRIVITDDGLTSLEKKLFKNEIDAPLNSKTLQNLIATYDGAINISASGRDKSRKTIIEIPEVILQKELTESITKARTIGLNDFVLNFVRASLIVIILSIPAYLYIGIPVAGLFLTILIALSLAYNLQVRVHWVALLLASISALTLLPILSQNVTTCSDISTLPWIWNHVLTVGFFIAVTVSHHILRWMPIAVLTIETIVLPYLYPSDCSSIYLGSLPAIPLIIVMAISVLQVRKREFKYDSLNSLTVERLLQVSNDVDIYRENALDALIEDAKAFSFRLGEISESSLEALTLEIQKIQTYLVCSEYFESKLVRNIYEIFSISLKNGIPGKVSILGSNLAMHESKLDFEAVIHFIEKEKAQRPLSLTLINQDSLELHFDGYSPDEVADTHSSKIAGLSIFKNL